MTRYEKRALTRFRLIYLGSLFGLAFIIAFLVYQNRHTAMLEIEKYKMQHYASGLSAYIISTHMQSPGNAAKADGFFMAMPREAGFEVALYDDRKTARFREFDIAPESFAPGFYQNGETLLLIEQSTYMHLGVEYVAVRATGIHAHEQALKRDVLAMLALSLGIIAAIGFYLSRLFMVPVREEIGRIDRFIKDTTHELNTPISAILMSVSLLKKMAIEPKVVRRIELSAKRVSTIYNDLAYLFFNDLHKKEAVSIDWEALIRRRSDYFRDFAQMKQITFHLDLKPFRSQMDKESATRLLDNLISNAIKYNRIGGTVSFALKEGRLSIADTGIGIDEAAQKEVFKRYKRANDTEGGFGVGLDIVAAVCREYNITLELESQKNLGTRFILTF